MRRAAFAGTLAVGAIAFALMIVPLVTASGRLAPSYQTGTATTTTNTNANANANANANTNANANANANANTNANANANANANRNTNANTNTSAPGTLPNTGGDNDSSTILLISLAALLILGVAFAMLRSSRNVRS